MIRVRFFSLLRLYLGKSEVAIEADDITVKMLIYRVRDATGSDLVIEKLLDENASLLLGTIILVNGQNILHLENLDTRVKDGDEVSLFPPGAGG